jgi:hypothetical protein
MGLIVEFILGTLVEGGIKVENALQERGLGYLVPIVLLLVILLCLGACGALVAALLLLTASSSPVLSIH